jgi:hypothetical protein
LSSTPATTGQPTARPTRPASETGRIVYRHRGVTGCSRCRAAITRATRRRDSAGGGIDPVTTNPAETTGTAATTVAGQAATVTPDTAVASITAGGVGATNPAVTTHAAAPAVAVYVGAASRPAVPTGTTRGGSVPGSPVATPATGPRAAERRTVATVATIAAGGSRRRRGVRSCVIARSAVAAVTVCGVASYPGRPRGSSRTTRSAAARITPKATESTGTSTPAAVTAVTASRERCTARAAVATWPA